MTNNGRLTVTISIVKFFLINYVLVSAFIMGMQTKDFFAELPIELHDTIVRKMVDTYLYDSLQQQKQSIIKKMLDNKISKKASGKKLWIHVLFGNKFLNELHLIQEFCKKGIVINKDKGWDSKRKQLVGLEKSIFCLSKKERDALISLDSVRHNENFAVNQEFYDIIARIENKNITHGLTLKIISDNTLIRMFITLGIVSKRVIIAVVMCALIVAIENQLLGNNFLFNVDVQAYKNDFYQNGFFSLLYITIGSLLGFVLSRIVVESWGIEKKTL